MDNQPPLDRGILLPILLGGFSILGIIVVLVIGRSLNSPPPVSASPSATAFQYIYLGTEPAITTPLTEESGIPFPTEVPVEVTPSAFLSPTPPSSSLASPTSPSVSTPIILTKANTTRTSTSIVQRTNTPIGPATLTPTFNTPVSSDTYDDTDTRLAYTGSWVSQAGVTGAYQGTLHISNTIGNKITFSFTGPEIHIFYQAGPSLGSMTITIDNLGGLPVSQAQSQTQITEWVDNDLPTGTHVVEIVHASGGSINVDSLVVPAPTATPTRTPTPNPTQ